MTDLCPACDCLLEPEEDIIPLGGIVYRRVTCESCQQKFVLDQYDQVVRGYIFKEP